MGDKVTLTIQPKVDKGGFLPNIDHVVKEFEGTVCRLSNAGTSFYAVHSIKPIICDTTITALTIQKNWKYAKLDQLILNKILNELKVNCYGNGIRKVDISLDNFGSKALKSLSELLKDNTVLEEFSLKYATPINRWEGTSTTTRKDLDSDQDGNSFKKILDKTSLTHVTINYHIGQNILKCFTIHKNPNIIKLDLIDSFNSNNYKISNFDGFAQPINVMPKLTEFILTDNTKNDVKLKVLDSLNYQHGNLRKLLDINNEQEVVDLVSPSPQWISSNNMHIDDDISEAVTVMSISDSSSRASTANSYQHIDPALARAVSQSRSNGGPSCSSYLVDNPSTYLHSFPCTLFTYNHEDHFSRTPFAELSKEMQDPKLDIVFPRFPELKYHIGSESLAKDRKNTDAWKIFVYFKQSISPNCNYINSIPSFNFEEFKKHKIMYHHAIILNAASTFLSNRCLCDTENYVLSLVANDRCDDGLNDGCTDRKSFLRNELKLPDDPRSQFYAHAIEVAIRKIARNPNEVEKLYQFVNEVKSNFDLISCLESIPGFEDYNEETDEIEETDIIDEDESSGYALNTRITPGILDDALDLYSGLPDHNNIQNAGGLFHYHDSV
ncbi:hypothetical protein [Orientia tsutsugamushi]|uniref:Uncharacterized protein n=1 Tax=Orientia tsutsugamushi (strain Boryong) TaxID=357244 RepID=A5CDV8_ORITB|nr:hypothetical protein [Orientia tsutsugamushi]CAM80125.1 hypothetical protein OTBS_1059 [Orientia tsutsugamushi str. Boryong]